MDYSARRKEKLHIRTQQNPNPNTALISIFVPHTSHHNTPSLSSGGQITSSSACSAEKSHHGDSKASNLSFISRFVALLSLHCCSLQHCLHCDLEFAFNSDLITSPEELTPQELYISGRLCIGLASPGFAIFSFSGFATFSFSVEM